MAESSAVSTPQTTAPSDHQASPVTSRRFPAAIGLILLLCLPTVFIVYVYQPINPRLLKPGDPAPTLTVRDPSTSEIAHISLDGKLTALLFFSADCPHCQREISNFDQLNRRFGNRILFLAISRSSKLRTAELISADQLKVKTLVDEEKIGQNIFGVDAVPALFLVGSDGIIAYSASGEKTFAAREQLLLDFVNSSGPPHN